jgi:hypothetical protein
MASISALYMPASRRRPWSPWLIASVAANLILLGLILSWELFAGPPAHRPMREVQRSVIPSLSAPDADIVTAAIQKLDRTQVIDDAKAQAEFARVQAAMAANPFDAGALDTAFEAAEAARMAHFRQVRMIVVDELTAVSPEARALLAAAMNRENQRPRPQ